MAKLPEAERKSFIEKWCGCGQESTTVKKTTESKKAANFSGSGGGGKSVAKDRKKTRSSVKLAFLLVGWEFRFLTARSRCFSVFS